jgi:hypothetical protein
MVKRPAPGSIALTARERTLLFCVSSGTNWQRVGITGETVRTLIVKGLIVRDPAGRLALTDNGWAALRALLPDL